MSKPLSSVKDEKARTKLALQRYAKNSKGLGWLSARDYLVKKGALPK